MTAAAVPTNLSRFLRNMGRAQAAIDRIRPQIIASLVGDLDGVGATDVVASARIAEVLEDLEAAICGHSRNGRGR